MAAEKPVVEAISKALFADRDLNVYAVLDGASVEDLLDRLYDEEPEFICLYRGELAPDMAAVAPYLVRLENGSAFARWVVEQGWGGHWGIFALTGADLRTMRQHFRRLLQVYDENGKPLLFRYYDPRVLRVYLPTCNAEETAEFFGPVSCFAAEGEDPTVLLRFQPREGTVGTEKIDLAPA